MHGVRTAASVTGIEAADIPAVAAFLHAHLNQRISAAQWSRSIVTPWPGDAPNHGFVLRSASDAGPDAVVGVLLAFYSERIVDGTVQRFCNIGAWCVLPEHRSQGLRLVRALLAQRGYHFTDLSPSGNVVPLNARLGFRHLDTTTAIAVNTRLPAWQPTSTILSNEEDVVAALDDRQLQIHLDHRTAAAVHHVVIRSGDRSCYVMVRRDRRKGLPLFATVIHASDTELLRREFPALCRHLLLRHRVMFTLVEERVAGGRPSGSRRLASARPKMVRSPLADSDIDYLYSELTCVPW